MAIEIVLKAKADKNEQTNPPTAAARKTFWRPHVSAKKPHKWLVKTTPKNEMALSIPCSWVVNSKSHLACGKI